MQGEPLRDRMEHIYRLSSTFWTELLDWDLLYMNLNFLFIWNGGLGSWGQGRGHSMCQQKDQRRDWQLWKQPVLFLLLPVYHFNSHAFHLFTSKGSFFFPVFFSGGGGGGVGGGGGEYQDIIVLLTLPDCLGTVDTLALKKMTHFPAVAHCHFVELFWFMPQTSEELGITSKPEFYQWGGQSTDNGDMQLGSFRM